jgi:CHAD domain-containing protein
MEEVDGHRTWHAVKRLPRTLFRALGTLRDLHVLEAWVKQLAAVDDPVRSKLLKVLEDREARPKKKVRRVIKAFDQARWERLVRKAVTRARLVPPNSPTAQCLVLERYEDLSRLHTHAMHRNAPGPWHALRVGLKRFRYAVEILLPERSGEWDDGLGRMQSLLGEIHDLDVLRSRIADESDGIDATSVRSLRHAITTKRRACLAQYRQNMSGEGHLLRTWRAGLPDGQTIASATAARLRTTTRAMDPHARRTATVARLALAVYDGLTTTSGAARRLRDDRLRMILDAAARLHGIDVDDRQIPRHKAARDFLRAVPAPPGWSPHEWMLLTQVVRYHRGAEPAPRHRSFGQLSRERRNEVRGLAGIVRLARGLRRCGVTSAAGVRIDDTAAYVRLRVSGLQDTEDNAARLAAAKHLLEAYLRRPIMIEPTKAARSVHGPRLAYSAAHAHTNGVAGLRGVSEAVHRARAIHAVSPHLRRQRG